MLGFACDRPMSGCCFVLFKYHVITKGQRNLLCFNELNHELELIVADERSVRNRRYWALAHLSFCPTRETVGRERKKINAGRQAIVRSALPLKAPKTNELRQLVPANSSLGKVRSCLHKIHESESRRIPAIHRKFVLIPIVEFVAIFFFISEKLSSFYRQRI